MDTVQRIIGYASRTTHSPSVLFPTALLLLFPTVLAINRFLNDRVQNNWQSDAFDWPKELVVLTGSSQGIGAEILRLLEEAQIKVIVLDLVAPRVVAPTSHYYQCDLSSADAIVAVAQQIREQHGEPMVLVNNAGTINPATLLATSETRLLRLFSVNTMAPVRLIRVFLPAMVRANHGMIVKVSSMAAFVTPPGMVDYCMSKTGAIALHEGLSSELVSRYNAPRVRTICVVASFVRTPLAWGFRSSAFLEASDVAKAIVTQILKGRSGWFYFIDTYR